MGDWRTKLPLLLGGVAAGLLVLLLAVPLVALLLRTVQMGALGPALRNPTVIAALQLSLLTACISLAVAILLGTPLAYALARVPFPGRGAVEALVEVPIVLPPAVAGIALLMAFGRRGPPRAAPGGRRDQHRLHHGRRRPGPVLRRRALLRPLGQGGLPGRRPRAGADRLHPGGVPLRDVPPDHRPPRLPLPAGRRRAVLGAGPGRVRGHDHVRRLLPRAHPDHAPGHLRRPGVRPRGRPGPGHHPGPRLHRRPGPGALGHQPPGARERFRPPGGRRCGRLRTRRPGRAAATA